jgi:hypothetical protein
MLINKLPNDSEEATAHRDVVHGGHIFGGLEVFAVFDGGWDLSPEKLTCRLCAWPKTSTTPVDEALYDAIVVCSEASR